MKCILIFFKLILYKYKNIYIHYHSFIVLLCILEFCFSCIKTLLFTIRTIKNKARWDRIENEDNIFIIYNSNSLIIFKLIKKLLKLIPFHETKLKLFKEIIIDDSETAMIGRLVLSNELPSLI